MTLEIVVDDRQNCPAQAKLAYLVEAMKLRSGKFTAHRKGNYIFLYLEEHMLELPSGRYFN
jgi:hypothetical protein